MQRYGPVICAYLMKQSILFINRLDGIYLKKKKSVTRICRPVSNERLIHNGHTSAHGVKFRSAVLLNGLIINLEGQWKSRRQDCVLCFMNQIG